MQDSQSAQTIGRAHRRGRLYHLVLHIPVSSNSSHSLAGVVLSAADLSHKCLGYISETRLKTYFIVELLDKFFSFIFMYGL